MWPEPVAGLAPRGSMCVYCLLMHPHLWQLVGLTHCSFRTWQ